MLDLPMSQALHHHYPTQHFPNTFADVFADSHGRELASSLSAGAAQDLA
jgi:hypothetical protein